MTHWNNYHLANSVDNALQALADSPGTAALIAGGTDLLLDLQQGNRPPVDSLVDVSSVPEMTQLLIRDSELYIGASVPHAKIAASPLVREHAAALATASGLIGGPQVRNTATLGGNVGHALPAADGTIALVALDAEAEVAGFQGRRRVPIESLFIGPGKSALDPTGEILVGFYLPLRESNHSSAFKRVMRPQGVAIALLNAAVWLHRRDNKIVDARISLGPSGPVPRRLRDTEAVLIGEPYSPAAVDAAIEVLHQEANFRTSRHRATSEYRHRLAAYLMGETISMAWESAFKRGI